MTTLPTTRTRGPHGGGSIYWDEGKARWIVCVELPRQRHEPRRRRKFSATTRDAAEAKLAAYREEYPAQEFLGRAEYVARARSIGTHTEGEWWALVRSVKKRCYYCGVTTEAVFTDPTDPLSIETDHLIPVSRGGSDSIDNIVVSCRGCSSEKGTMTADEYVAWKARQ